MKYRIEYKRYLLLLVAFMLTGTESYAADQRKKPTFVKKKLVSTEKKPAPKRKNQTPAPKVKSKISAPKAKSKKNNKPATKSATKKIKQPSPSADDDKDWDWLDKLAGEKIPGDQEVVKVLNASPLGIGKKFSQLPKQIEQKLQKNNVSPFVAWCAKWLAKPFCSEAAAVLTPIHWINKKLFYPSAHYCLHGCGNKINSGLNYCGLEGQKLTPMKNYMGNIAYIHSFWFVRTIWKILTTPAKKRKPGEVVLSMRMSMATESILEGFIKPLSMSVLPACISGNFLWTFMGLYYVKELLTYGAKKLQKEINDAYPEKTEEEREREDE